MRATTLTLSTCLLFACGSPLDDAPTCSEAMGALYAVKDCAMYNITVKPPAMMSLSEATFWCRQVVAETQQKCSDCEDRLADWLSCTPSACPWSQPAQMFLANNCNDELERLTTCCGS